MALKFWNTVIWLSGGGLPPKTDTLLPGITSQIWGWQPLYISQAENWAVIHESATVEKGGINNF